MCLLAHLLEKIDICNIFEEKKNQILTLKSENSKLKTGKSMLHFISVQQVHLVHSRAVKIYTNQSYNLFQNSKFNWVIFSDKMHFKNSISHKIVYVICKSKLYGRLIQRYSIGRSAWILNEKQFSLECTYSWINSQLTGLVMDQYTCFLCEYLTNAR